MALLVIICRTIFDAYIKKVCYDVDVGTSNFSM